MFAEPRLPEQLFVNAWACRSGQNTTLRLRSLSEPPEFRRCAPISAQAHRPHAAGLGWAPCARLSVADIFAVSGSHRRFSAPLPQSAQEPPNPPAMKSFAAAALLAAQGPLRASAEVANPISRVVGLLQGLRTKLEADMEAEESIFEKYVCWYKAIVESKTASNSAAESRIESLKSYVADIEAGRVTFTTEQKDLTKQVEGLRKDLQELEATRKTENEDYVAASAEMTKAITALTGAIAVIEDAAPSKASMLSVRSFRSRQSLLKALQLGQGLLGGAEVRYIESLVNGEVPQPDWKKLNRKVGRVWRAAPSTGCR